MLDKIKKLLAHAESAKQIGNLEEAQAFMDKVNELMQAHNISMHDVMMAAAQSNDKFADWVYGEYVSYKENLAGNRWRKDLIKMLCRHNMTGVIFSPHARAFRVYGRMEHVEVTVWLYNFLSERLLAMAKTSRAELSPDMRDMQCRHTYLKNYLDGAIIGIEWQFNQRGNKYRRAMHDLMVVHDKMLDEYLNKVAPGWTSSKASARSGATDLGKAEGYAAGKGMSLGGRLANGTAQEQEVKKRLLR